MAQVQGSIYDQPCFISTCPSLTPQIVLKQVPLDTLNTSTFGQGMLRGHAFGLHGPALPTSVPPPSLLPFAHSAPATLALPSLYCSELVPASGPLCLLFPLPATTSPQIFPGLALYHHSVSVITPWAS